MAITIGGGFNVTSSEPVDMRIIKTKEQMKNMTTPQQQRMPEIYFCLCSEDKKFYIYDATAEPNDETGKFRSLEEFMDFSSSEQAQETINDVIDNSQTITDIKEEISTMTADGGEISDEEETDDTSADGGEIV